MIAQCQPANGDALALVSSLPRTARHFLNEENTMTTGPTNDPADTDGTLEDTEGHARRLAEEQTAKGDDDVEGHIYVQEPGAPGSRDR